MPSLLIIVQIIDSLLAAGQFADTVLTKWTGIRSSIQAMIDAGRDPSDDEWAAFRAQLDGDLSAIEAIVQKDAQAAAEEDDGA